MSKQKSHTRKNKPPSRKNKPPSRKPLRKSMTKPGRKNNKRATSKQPNTDTLTRRNWMKKLLFTGGDASHHAESVYGGIGQQHAISGGNNAIYQNALGMGSSSLPTQVAPM